MSHLLAQRSDGLFPATTSGKLTRTLKHMHAQAIALEHADALQIARSVQATRRGMAGIAQIAAERRAWASAFPEAEGLLNGAAEAGAATILSRIIETGF